MTPEKLDLIYNQSDKRSESIKQIKEDLINRLKSWGCTDFKIKEENISRDDYEIVYEAILPGSINSVTVSAKTV